jgi:hypothetical protein
MRRHLVCAGIFNTVVVSIVCIAFNNSIRSDSNSKAAKVFAPKP